MRKIKEIVISDSGDDYVAIPSLSELEMRFCRNKFSQVSSRYIPFHYLIYQDGQIVGIHKDSEVVPFYTGHSRFAINLCLIGGKVAGNRKVTVTVPQSNSLFKLLYRYSSLYNIPYRKILFKLSDEVIYRTWFDSVFKDSLSYPLFHGIMLETFEPFNYVL